MTSLIPKAQQLLSRGNFTASSSALTCLIVGEVQHLHAIWVGDVCRLGLSIVVDLSTRGSTVSYQQVR